MKFTTSLTILSFAVVSGAAGSVNAANAANAEVATETVTTPATNTAQLPAKPKAAPKNQKTLAKKTKKAKSQDTLKSSSASATSAATYKSSDAVSDYTTYAVDRPLILPKGIKQAAASMNMNRVSMPNTVQMTSPGKLEVVSASTTSWATDFAFETGIGNHIQVGGGLETILSPDAEVGFIFGNAQYGINEMVNARVDLGFARNHGSDMNVILGVGAPAKYKLNADTALISGRSDTLSGINGTGQTDDIFTIANSSGGSVESLGVPVGVQHSFTSQLSGSARTGYRAVITSAATTSYIPLNVDAQFTPIHNVDVVATMGFDGPVSSVFGYTDFFSAGVMGRFRF